MTVEGGLEEPEALQPEQGSLALLLPGDEHHREDWDKAAAGVLRKARWMTEDDPDAEAWHRLCRRTLDGIDVPPLGTPDLLRGLDTEGRPTRAGAWDVRTRLGGGTAETLNAEALADLDGGAASLWLRPGDSDLATVLDGVLLDLAPVVLDAPDDPLAAAEAFLGVLGGTSPAPGTNLGVPGTAPDDLLLAVADRARSAGVLGVVVDATALHERGASDAQELAWSMVTGARVLRVLEGAGVAAARRRGAARVPVRRHRRAVPHHRQAPRRPAALGPGARPQRRRPGGPAPARRHQSADDEQVRPLGEHAAHHRGRLRGRRRRRRRGDRAAVRQPAGTSGRVRPPDRPQHLRGPRRGVAPGPGHRPGGRLLRRREAHPRLLSGGVGHRRCGRGRRHLGRPDRAGRRPPRRGRRAVASGRSPG